MVAERDAGVLRVGPDLVIPLGELEWRFSTAGGPGGQHVNTSHTRAEVRLNIEASPSLPEQTRARLLDQLGPVVQVAAGERRSQARNRELALDRLCARLAAALHVDPPRRPTRPTMASKRRRLESKRRQSDRKRDRQNGWPDG